MGDLQKRKVDMIIDKVLDMNVFEIRYFQLRIKERILNTSGINPMKINLDWPSVKQEGKLTLYS